MLIDDLLLEILDILSRPQAPRRGDRADRRQTQRFTSSPIKTIRRTYQSTVRNLDHSSLKLARPENPILHDTAKGLRAEDRAEPEGIGILPGERL